MEVAWMKMYSSGWRTFYLVLEKENVEDDVKAKVARKQLTGAAQAWYYAESDLLEKEPITWETFQTAIKKRFLR